MKCDPMVIEWKLRDHHGVRGELLEMICSELRMAGSLRSTNKYLEERIKYLEQHVPPEIANPPAPAAYGPKRSKWD